MREASSSGSIVALDNGSICKMNARRVLWWSDDDDRVICREEATSKSENRERDAQALR